MSTVKDLKKTLKVAGVKHSSRANKAALQKLVDGLPKPEVQTEPTKAPPSSEDIKIGIAVRMQDGSIHDKELAIVNPGGCIMKSQLNNPDQVFAMVKQGLVQMYGANHIKG